MGTRVTLLHALEAPDRARVALLWGDAGPSGAWQGAHPLDAAAVEAERAGLRRALRRVVQRGRERDHEALVAHARLLFDLLIPGPIKDALRAAGEGGQLTVVTEPGVAPWPLLHDGARFLGRAWALGELHPGASSTTRREAADRLLIVADPAGDLPAARYEGEALVRDLARGDLACDLRLGRLRRGDFLRVFKSFRMVHFAGHVDPADAEPAGWRLADGRVDAAALRALGGGSAPDLVFANACSSDAADAGAMTAALRAAGVRHVVATAVDLPDLQGADFAGRFYGALRGGAPIGEALRVARQASADADAGVWAAYRLFGDPGAVYFRARPGERRVAGVRRAVVVALRRAAPEAEDAEALAEKLDARRAEARRRFAAEGGRLLPGRGAVERAVFGLPISYENDVERAARAAFALAEEPGVVVALEAGPLVSTGADVVGDAALRAEAAVWRLPAGAHVLPGAARRLADRVRLGPAEAGARPLLGLAAERVAPTPIVGRAAELGRLVEAADAALERQEPAAATVLGPVGIGKSCLAEAVLTRADRRYRVLRGAAVPYDEVRPFAAAAGVLRGLLDLDEGASPEHLGRELDALLDRLDAEADPDPLEVLSIDALLSGGGQTGPRLAERRDALGALLGLQVTGADAVEPGVVPAALRQLLEAVARTDPLLVLFEDLHWLPDAGLAVVDELVAGLRPGAPVFVLATARPELLERAPRWFDAARHLRVDLGPLEEADADALLRRLLPAAEAHAELRARAEGNPLFLRELALARAEGDEAPPATVEAVMQARVDRQPPFHQDVLRAAAVLGRTFWREGVERLLDARPERVEAALRDLERRGFVVHQVGGELAGLSQWRFTHALLQEVLHHGLPQRARIAWHGRAALWLSDEVSEAAWARVAAHRAAAGDHPRAAEAWLRAADQALEAFAPLEAQKALESALAADDAAGGRLPVARRAEAEAALAERLHAAGEPQEAARRLDDALAHTPPEARADRAERLRKRAEIDESRGELTAARARLAEGLALLVGRDDGASRRVRALIRRDEAWLQHRDGHYDTAVTGLEALLEEVDTTDHALLGGVYNALGVVTWRRGDDEAAARWYRRAMAAYEAAGSSRNLAAAYNNLGILAMRRGDYRAAEQWYQRNLRIKVDTGDRAGLARAYNNLGSLYGLMGEYAKAARFIEESIRIRTRSGHSGLAICYANLGECYLKQGRHAEARERLEAAIALCRDGRGPAYLLPDAGRMLAELHLAEGAPEAAVDAVSEALAVAEDSGDRPRAAVARRVLAEALVAAGRPADAVDHLTRAVADLEALDQPEELGRAYAAQAAVEADAARAADLRARAEQLLRR